MGGRKDRCRYLSKFNGGSKSLRELLLYLRTKPSNDVIHFVGDQSGGSKDQYDESKEGKEKLFLHRPESIRAAMRSRKGVAVDIRCARWGAR